MENRISIWNKWSVIRKAQIIGVLVGSLVTLLLFLNAFLTPDDNSPKGHESYFLSEKAAATLLPSVPAILICKLLGFESLLARGWSWEVSLPTDIVINASLLFIFGTLVGWFMKWMKGTKTAA